MTGKAGGFLALDWNAGAVGDLAEYSYNLHADLAKELGAERLGYRPVSTLAVSLSARPGLLLLLLLLTCSAKALVTCTCMHHDGAALPSALGSAHRAVHADLYAWILPLPTGIT